MSMQNLPEKQIDPVFVSEVRQIIQEGRRSAYASVNTAMVTTYWNLGGRIVQEEQKGQVRAASEGWNTRTLERNISTQYYYRLLQTPDPERVKQEMLEQTKDFRHGNAEFVKSPIVAEFLGLMSNGDFSESDLETSILNHLQHFLMELGKGFAFVAGQKHIHTDAGDYFIDLK